MSRGPEGEPRVSGRVESPAPRPDTVTDWVIVTAVLALCVFVAPWLASLV